VAPPGFQGARRGEQADVWIPSNLVPRVAPAGVNLQEDEAPVMVFARLHPGETLFEAKRRFVQDAVDELARSSKRAMLVVPLADVFGAPDARTIVIGERRAGSVVAGLAGLVLLAGCATLMALVLVHYEQRRRELAVRIALGATRGRLATELSVELAWLAAGGTAGALLVAVWSLRILPALSLPGGVDLGRLDLSLDWRVLFAALSITVLTLVAAALLPMARFTRASLAGELIAANSTTPASSQRLRQVLLGLHTAATIIVLIAAGLFVRAVIHGFGAGAGFDIDCTAYVQVQVVQPFAGSESADARLAAIDESTRRLDDGLRALPGVEEVAIGRSPIGQDQASYVLTPTLIETRDARRELRVGVLAGGWQLLPALGVRVLRGRALAAADAGRRPYPALLTESLARTLWPAEEALGQVLSLGPRRGSFNVVRIVPEFV
jgi:putative ABC transport system permease protein